MSKNQATIALNIGSQRISMASFKPSSKGGLILSGYDSVSVLADPSAESTRLSQVRVAVAELAKKLKVGKSSKLSYAISGQSVFTRFIKLPPIDDDNLEQLVAFEAQQHIPFPLEEVIWDWTQLESLPGEKEVAIVAIRRDALNDVNDVVSSAGLGTKEVDAAPMALYSALRYNYADLSESTLLVDIGAKTCNLVYAEGERMFTRSVNVGGAAITSAIVKDYGVSFEDAEIQKCQNGVVGLNSHQTMSMDESTAALSTVIRNALGKLPAEISRTTNYFRSQHGISAPKRVMLAGGGANLTYIADFLQEKLNLPVEFFNPLQAVSVAKGVNVDQVGKDAHMLGELVGLGLRGINRAALNIDLVPDTVSQERDIQRRKPYLYAAAAVLILGVGAWAASNVALVNSADTMHAELEAKKAERTPYSEPLVKIAKSEKELGLIADKLVSAQNSRVMWVDMWTDLAERFASDSVWLVDFDPVVGFDPASVVEGNPGDIQSVIVEDFDNVEYGNTALTPLAKKEVKKSKSRKAAKENKKAEAINAIRVKGFWRGTNGHKEVTQLLDSLRSDSTYFDVLPSEKIIVSLPTRLEQGDYAAPFELILPLRERVSTPVVSQ
ncbi:MAG: Amuc_1101 family PilM-like pilus complex protein [Akkermansiaceae bacterium]